MLSKIFRFFYKSRYFLLFFFLLFLLNWKIFFKGYLLGPFDLLMGYYSPFVEIARENQELFDAAYHFKNDLLSDVITIMIPLKITAVNMLRQGFLPLWNPYILNGSPLAASVLPAVFYPANILYFILPPATAYTIYILIQPLLAFYFMHLLLKLYKFSKFAVFVGAISFAFSSFLIGWLAWATYGHAYLWLPFIIYSLEKYARFKNRKYFLFALVGLSLSFFAGHSQTAVMVWFVSAFYVFWIYYGSFTKKILLRSFLLFIIAVFIIAVQFLPTAEMYLQSVRDTMASESFFLDQTLGISSYLQAFVPDFFGNPVTRNWWGKINYVESAIYFGSLAVLFCLYAMINFKKRRFKRYGFFFSLIVFAMILSTANPISRLVFDSSLPLISSSTFARYSAIFIFAGCVLSAFGADHLLIQLKKRQSHQSLAKFFLITLFFIFAYWIFILLRILPEEFVENIAVITRNSILPSIIIAVVCLAVLTHIFILKYGFGKKVFGKGIFFLKLIIVFLVCFEMFRYAYKFLPFSPREFFYPKHNLISRLEKYTNDGRYRYALPANINSMFAVSGVEGLDPLYSRQIAELASMGQGNIKITDRAALEFKGGIFQERVLDLFSMKYFADRKDSDRNDWVDGHEGGHEAFNRRFKVLFTDKIFTIYQNNYALDRFKLFYKSEIVPEKEKRLQRLTDPKFDYQNIVILENEGYLLNGKKGVGIIKVIENKPDRQKYSVKTNIPALFFISDTYYPGWKAYVNGRQTEILRANHAFRAVALPEGISDITFFYKPESFLLGLFLSVLGIGCVFVLAVEKKFLTNAD